MKQVTGLQVMRLGDLDFPQCSPVGIDVTE